MSAVTRPSAGRTSARVAGMSRSATAATLDAVHALRARGMSVLDLGAGEPDGGTAPHIVAAGTAALEEGFVRYTPSRGIPALRSAIASKLLADNGIAVDPDGGVMVTPSGKHALFAAVMALADPGDEVVIAGPAWVSYAEMIHLAGAQAVRAAPDPADGFRFTREVLEAAVSGRTRALIVNTPCNPTGRVLDEAEIEEIAAFAERNDLVVVSDEIYEKIVYDGHRHRSLAAHPALVARTFTVNGFSKNYAMTGWRLGYLAGPEPLVSAALKVQEHTVSCAASFTQRAGVAALTGSQAPLSDMVRTFAERRTRLVQGLNSVPGVRCPLPEGAFYAFADIRGTGLSSDDFAALALREAGVALNSGRAFGPEGEGYVRFSFATSLDAIEEAVARLSKVLTAR